MEENHDHLLQAPKAAIGYEDNLEGDRGGREGRVQAHKGEGFGPRCPRWPLLEKA